jgi:S1-C subfamily serine protease
MRTPSLILHRAILIALLISSVVAFGGEIHTATERGDFAAVTKLLLKNPKLASRKDDKEHTPLHIAAAKGYLAIVRLLLQNDSDVNARDRSDYTPLHMAAFNGNPDIVELLLENGAKPDAKAYRGLTPSDVARKRGFRGIVFLIGGKYESFGTGFFVTDDGYLVTNEHVVKGSNKVQVITKSGTNDARIVFADKTNDLALLKIDLHSAALPVATSTDVVLGATAATVGFPLPMVEGFSPKLAKGEIASLSGIRDDPRIFQISLPVLEGNSGGALLDERGNTVGVVYAGLRAAAVYALTMEMPENVNYAIKGDILLDFLNAIPEVSGKLKRPNQDTEKFVDIVKSGEISTAQVRAFVQFPWYHPKKKYP